MIHYKEVKYGETVVKFPKLHRVVYDTMENESVLAIYQTSYKDHLVNEWLKSNCKSMYYHSPGYLREKFIEFEDDEEAFVFTLKWGSM